MIAAATRCAPRGRSGPVKQPQRHCGGEPEPADQEMEICRHREQNRGGGQSFADQYDSESGEYQNVGGHLGLVAPKQPLAADDVLADRRHDHDGQHRVQRRQSKCGEQGGKGQSIARDRQQPGDDLRLLVANSRNQ